MRRRTKIVLAAVAAVVAVIGGAGFWYYVLQPDAPPEAALPDRSGEGESGGGAADDAAGGERGGDEAAGEEGDRDRGQGELAGDWTLVQAEDIFVGYRILEVFGGDTLKREAAGRTPAVEGSLTIEGVSITEVTMTADLTEMASDQARRDRFIQGDALEIEDFPEASFVLTEPIDLGELPAEGEEITAEAIGELTMHGVTREVTLSIEAQWNGDLIDVAGSTPIVLADYDIVAPDIGGIVKVDGDGTLEFQLTFQPA